MTKVKIVSRGIKTELWIDGKMISSNVVGYELSQEAGFKPRLEITTVYHIDEMEVEADNVDVDYLG